MVVILAIKVTVVIVVIVFVINEVSLTVVMKETVLLIYAYKLNIAYAQVNYRAPIFLRRKFYKLMRKQYITM